MSFSRDSFSRHEVRQGAMMDPELLDVNLDAIFMGARESVFFSALTAYLPFAACPETFPVNSAKTGGRWEAEIDTTADLVAGLALGIQIPGLVGKRMVGTGTVVDGVVQNGASLGARYKVDADDIIEPHWCEAVGQRLIRSAKFIAGSHTLSVSNADYLMILSEGHGVNKPRTSGERIGYHEDLVAQCQRSQRSQLLFVDLGFFMCQDDRLAASFTSMSSVTKKVQVEYENLRNLIVRPVVSWNRSSVDGGNDWVNAWDVGHFKVFEQPDAAALYSHASANRELLTGTTQEIELPTFIEARTIYNAEDESESLLNDGHVLMIPQMQSQVMSISGDASADQSKTEDLNFTNGVKALYIIGRTQAARDANDWMDTSGGHDGRDRVLRESLGYCEFLQGTTKRIDCTGNHLRTVEGFRYFGIEPRQAKTMLYTYPYENHRDLVSQQGVCNFARLRTKRMTLRAPAHAFEVRRINNTSGEMELVSGEKSVMQYFIAADSYQTLTFAIHRVVPAYHTPGH